jgi:hypothetical protein
VSLGAAERSPARAACTRSEAKGRSVSGGRRREAILFREEFGPPFVRTFSWPLNLWEAEGENRRAQPLFADRVGLKPRITEGHERAMGLVAAFVRARDEKDLREWPWHIAAPPAPKCEIRFTPPIGGRCLCTDCSKPSRRTSPLASILASSRIWSAPLPLSCVVKRMAGAVSGLLPIEDKATAMRIPSWSGEPLAAQSEPAVSRLIRKVSGLRHYRLPMVAMTSSGP